MSESPSPDTVGRFEGLADAYDRYRPRYPSEAIDAILDGLPPQPTVIDVGGGTGISTRALAAAGARAIAIEPNDEMRAAALAAGSDARAGTAYATGLADGCADAVAAFQAFPWFADARAIAEFRRLLRHRGRIALVWNERDRDDPFTRAFRDLETRFGETALLAGADFADASLAPLLAAGGFANVRALRFANAQRLDRNDLLGRARSTSYAPRAGPRLAEFDEALRELHARYADDDGTVALRYITEVFIAEPI